VTVGLHVKSFATVLLEYESQDFLNALKSLLRSEPSCRVQGPCVEEARGSEDVDRWNMRQDGATWLQMHRKE
jgi:hypothetical protein